MCYSKKKTGQTLMFLMYHFSLFPFPFPIATSLRIPGMRYMTQQTASQLTPHYTPAGPQGMTIPSSSWPPHSLSPLKALVFKKIWRGNCILFSKEVGQNKGLVGWVGKRWLISLLLIFHKHLSAQQWANSDSAKSNLEILQHLTLAIKHRFMWCSP